MSIHAPLIRYRSFSGTYETPWASLLRRSATSSSVRRSGMSISWSATTSSLAPTELRSDHVRYSTRLYICIPRIFLLLDRAGVIYRSIPTDLLVWYTVLMCVYHRNIERVAFRAIDTFSVTQFASSYLSYFLSWIERIETPFSRYSPHCFRELSASGERN